MPRLVPPAAVLDIAERLERAGYEAWCVGGAVRDALLGIPDLDWDLATSATPQQVREVFGHKRTIPVGIDFGTVGVLDRAGTMHEVTTFRRDVKTDGRHAEVEFGVSLDDDLARRDFTINAIAYSPRRDELRDPFDGQADLRRGVVRAVGDADARMREDRLRALRAIRFAARFGFELDDATLGAIERSAPHLGRLSAERVKQELEKTMDQVREPSAALMLWKRTGALATLVPVLAAVPDEALLALDALPMPGPRGRPRRRLDRLAALFLDVPFTGVTGALAALRFAKQEGQWIATLADRWGALHEELARALSPGGAATDERSVRRWVAAVGRLHVGSFMRLAVARLAVAPAGVDAAVARATYRRMLRSAFRDPLAVADLAIDGDDLRRAGVPPGPVVGKILHHLLAWVLDDPARNTPEQLLAEVQRYLGEHPQGG